MAQLVQKVAAIDIGEAKTHASREITSVRADMKRLESRISKTGEDASKALAIITELSNARLIAFKYHYQGGRWCVGVHEGMASISLNI